jgi:5-methylcytosine-specific restriction endonuclease McrA
VSDKRWGGRRVGRFRALVFAQYGTQCWLCGRAGADTVDHIVPIQWGGDMWSLANARPAHFGCNSGRGNRTRHYRNRKVLPKSSSNGTSRNW